jgi:hypothetical protein
MVRAAASDACFVACAASQHSPHKAQRTHIHVDSAVAEGSKAARGHGTASPWDGGSSGTENAKCCVFTHAPLPERHTTYAHEHFGEHTRARAIGGGAARTSLDSLAACATARASISSRFSGLSLSSGSSLPSSSTAARMALDCTISRKLPVGWLAAQQHPGSTTGVLYTITPKRK